MSLVLERWDYTAACAATAVVLPDGCRDVIVCRDPGARPRLLVSALSSGPEKHRLAAGAQLAGFRLRPGVRIDVPALRSWWDQGSREGVERSTLPRFARVDPQLEEALGALAARGESSPASVARTLGVSLRTLQRVLRAAHLPAPDFWRQLARGRRAARAIADLTPLAVVATESGYSDQAHLTRAIRRWFGVTPRQLQTSEELVAALRQPGYD